MGFRKGRRLVFGRGPPQPECVEARAYPARVRRADMSDGPSAGSIEQERSVLRWGGMAGLLGGIIFVASIVY